MNWRFWTWGRETPVPAAASPAPAPTRRLWQWRDAAPMVASTAKPDFAEQYREMLRRAKPAPGVVPAGARLAMDDASGFDNPAFSSWCAQVSAIAEGLTFLGYPYLSELTQRAEYRRPAEILAQEMTRNWLRITATGDEDKTERVKAIEAEFERLNVQAVFKKALELDGFFGRAQVHFDLGVDEGPELLTPLPLTPAKIAKGSLQGLRVIEPVWTYPNFYNSTNPLKADFYKPQTWFVLGQEVHASRLITIVGRPVPDMLKPAYAFGGMSLTQMMKPYVDNWLNTRQSVSDLIRMFSTAVLATNMEALLRPTGDAPDIIARMQVFNQGRDNRGLMMIDKNTETFENVSTPLGTLDALQAQTQEHQSSACGIPLVKLFGITPKGLNGSTDGEIQTFYESLEAGQQTLNPHVKRVLDVVQLSLFGDIDAAIGHAWNPLKHETASEQALTRKTEAETDAVLVGAAIVDPHEARTRLANDEEGPYAGLDLSDAADPIPPQDNAQQRDESDADQERLKS